MGIEGIIGVGEDRGQEPTIPKPSNSVKDDKSQKCHEIQSFRQESHRDEGDARDRGTDDELYFPVMAIHDPANHHSGEREHPRSCRDDGSHLNCMENLPGPHEVGHEQHDNKKPISHGQHRISKNERPQAPDLGMLRLGGRCQAGSRERKKNYMMKKGGEDF